MTFASPSLATAFSTRSANIIRAFEHGIISPAEAADALRSLDLPAADINDMLGIPDEQEQRAAEMTVINLPIEPGDFPELGI